MGNRSHRRAEQRRVSQWLSEKIARRIDRELAFGLDDPSAVVIGCRIFRALNHAEQRGSLTAKHILDVTCEERLVCRVGDELRNRQTLQARVRHNGQVREVTVPERFAAPRRNGVGFPTEGASYPLWIELPWEELQRSILQDERDVDQGQLKVAVKRKALALQVQYPQARCAMEACALAGLDWRVYLAS